jgi:hypothetical protein
MDPKVLEACRLYLPENASRLDDSRVHIYFDNALRFIRRCKDEYDLIIVDSTDPFGPSEGYFTPEFYGICYNALHEDGIMVNQQGSPFFKHDAEALQRSHQRIVKLFPISRVYQAHIPTYAAGYWLFGFSSKKYHPVDDLDVKRWKKLNLETEYYTPKLHVGAFYLPAFLEDVNDFLTSRYGKAIVTNSSLQLLLKQSPAGVDIVSETFYLTDQEKFLLLESNVGEGIFFAGTKHVAIKVVASYSEDQIITTDPAQLLEIEKAKKEFADE